MNTAIVFENVTKSFGDHQVVNQLDWSLPEHGTICLFGPSGCGKTTLLHLLAGICRPDSGRILGLKQRNVSMVF
ncbi:MAG TPA: ATP-binding cassette domain-containing protein, partial [Clostridia bacterium]